MEELLPILAITSDNYAPVFSFWESSLQLLGYPAAKLHVCNIGRLSPPFGYCTQSWRISIEKQLTEVVHFIKSNDGDFFLHTDTDIQFFPRFLTAQSEWLRWMRADGLDMLFMRERTSLAPHLREGEVNAGFYIVHCNERTLKFWEQVLELELADPKMGGLPPYVDQYHVNNGLRYRRNAKQQAGDFGVRWATIPDVQCIWSEPASEQELVEAAFHHAVNTQDKPALLRYVRDLVLARQPLPPLRGGQHFDGDTTVASSSSTVVNLSTLPWALWTERAQILRDAVATMWQSEGHVRGDSSVPIVCHEGSGASMNLPSDLCRLKAEARSLSSVVAAAVAATEASAAAVAKNAPEVPNSSGSCGGAAVVEFSAALMAAATVTKDDDAWERVQ